MVNSWDLKEDSNTFEVPEWLPPVKPRRQREDLVGGLSGYREPEFPVNSRVCVNENDVEELSVELAEYMF